MTTTILVLESVVLVLLTLLVAGLLRSHAEILRRLHALGAGLDPDDPSTSTSTSRSASTATSTSTAVSLSRPIDLRADTAGGFAPAVDLDGSGLRDDVVHVAIAGARGRTLLAFLSSGCLTCQGFWDVIADASRLDLPDDIRLVVVTKDASEESISALRKLAPLDVSVVMSSAAWLDYRVPGSPYFVLVDGALGRVRGEGTGARWDQVKNLLRQAADDSIDGASDDSREGRIDRELLAHGIEPGDPSLYRTADQIAADAIAEQSRA